LKERKGKKIFCHGVKIVSNTVIYAIPGYVYFLYLLFPFRFWKPFVFTNQTEVVVITVFFASTLLLFTLVKAYRTSSFRFSAIDLLFIIYGIYLLFRFKYPLEKEILYQSFSIVCIYLYFKNFPEKYLKGILFLLPIAGIIQIMDGINRFNMPWQNLSHITGIFQNTGLFGGFAALGFIVSTGLLLFMDSGKRYLKSIVLFFLCTFLTIQTYASGSRASWIAAAAAISFLLYRLISPSLRGALATKQSGIVFFFIFSCFLVLTVFFSNHLYHLKKDSADGRLLIAKVSMGMVKDAPIFGHGISGFKAEYLNYQAIYFQIHPNSSWANLADDVEAPFNEFLKIIIEQGIVGLLLFGCLLYFLLETQSSLRAERSNPNLLKNPQSTILRSGFLFMLIFGLFSYPSDKLPFVVILVFLVAGLSKNRKPVFKIQLRKISYLRIPALLAICVISLIIVANAYDYGKSCLTWNRALVDFAQDKEKSFSRLEKLYPELENNPVFLTTYGKALSFGKHFPKAAAVLGKAVKQLPLSFSYIELGKSYEAIGFPEKALACWNRAGLMVPSRFTPLFLTMKLYLKNKEYGMAKECAHQLLTKKIKIDNPEIGEMKREARDILNGAQPP